MGFFIPVLSASTVIPPLPFHRLPANLSLSRPPVKPAVQSAKAWHFFSMPYEAALSGTSIP